jgi:hypothetical protein
MKSKIMRDLFWDMIIATILSQGIWFAVRWAALEYLGKSDMRSFIKEYYLLVAIIIGVLVILYFITNGVLCLKRYHAVIDEYGISDGDMYERYKNAEKCCQYKVHGHFVFINTARGIICMTKSDIIDIKRKRVRHTRTVHKTVYGNVRYRERTNEYYTYHFMLKTKYGTFRNTVGNDGVLEDLSYLFV